MAQISSETINSELLENTTNLPPTSSTNPQRPNRQNKNRNKNYNSSYRQSYNRVNTPNNYNNNSSYSYNDNDSYYSANWRDQQQQQQQPRYYNQRYNDNRSNTFNDNNQFIDNQNYDAFNDQNQQPQQHYNRSNNNSANKRNKPSKTEQHRISQDNLSQSSHKPDQHKPKKQPIRNKPAVKQNETRSEILIDQLMKFQLECMVCCHKIKDDKSIWSCNTCYHIFHLYCIKKWANSPSAKISEEEPTKWRCPGCQTTLNQIPNKYTCFCGKKTNPELSRGDENKPYHLRQLPHSCGQVCGRPLAKLEQENKNLICKHSCVLSCHPGPCQQCEALVTRTCNCGKAKFQVKCSSTKIPLCETKCDKLLNCSKHECGQICHSGDCKPCDIDIEQHCFSHDTIRMVKCKTREMQSKYSCDLKCGQLLSCGKHYCDSNCHEGACTTCPLMPSKLNYCPCGKTQIRELLIQKKIIRTSCTDPIPTCEKQCSKLLHTIESKNNKIESDLHFCESKCHLNECPPCKKQIEIKCRCGKETEKIECHNKQIKLCNRRCHKKKLCGRHQCNEMCCDDKDHFCTIVCNRQLDCGSHKCEQLCHKGPCQRCLIASFDERICECGKTVQYPPIRCGTKPLDCSNPCTRAHDCEHPINHSCHWEDKCPPCSYLTSKMCMGNHELRHNIPCYMKDVSCGRLCGKQLPNCCHKCVRVCHKDEICLNETESCQEPCTNQRPHCEHICNEPCHPNERCPDTVCQAIIQAKCKCGLKQKQIKCLQRMYEPASQIVFENLASELKEMLSCRSIDINTFKSTDTLKKKHELSCDDDCLIAERSKALAQALQIEIKPKVIYSDFLKNYAREDPSFTADVETKFESFVREMKLNTKQNKKMFNLPVMKSYERRFIHELASFYGFETASQDPEPHRNVCIFAIKDKCYLPSPSLLQSIEVKTKQPTMPRLTNLKQLNQVASAPLQSNLKVLQYQEADYLPVSTAFAGLNDEIGEQQAVKKNEKVIDYFDITD